MVCNKLKEWYSVYELHIRTRGVFFKAEIERSRSKPFEPELVNTSVGKW